MVRLLKKGRRKKNEEGRCSCKNCSCPSFAIKRFKVLVSFLLIIPALLALAGQVRKVSRSTSVWTYFSGTFQKKGDGGQDAASFPIGINLNATLAKDVLGIHHYADQAKIEVSLRSNAECPRPFLVGRLSGPVLVKIQAWKWKNASLLEGYYRVPVGGHYNLEVVALYCNDFLYEMTHLVRQETASSVDDWLSEQSPMAKILSYNFTHVCVDEVLVDEVLNDKHRLTASNASIWVDSKTAARTAKDHAHHYLEDNQLNKNRWTGYWWHKNWTKQQPPVYTRYQPLHCKDKRFGSCLEPTNLDRFEDYEFRWWSSSDDGSSNVNNPNKIGESAPKGHLDVTKLLHAVQQQQPKNTTVICLVGASHSDRLHAAARQFHLDVRDGQLLAFGHVNANYPPLATPHRIVNSGLRGAKCDKLIIGVGQWAAGKPGGKPTLLDEYYQQIQTMVRNLKEDERTKNTEVYLRSIHYHGLGFRLNECPPEDWRTPLIIDAYNHVIERVCREFNVPFVDTRDISGPVWDSAPDWNHLAPRVNEPELLYLAAAALGVRD